MDQLSSRPISFALIVADYGVDNRPRDDRAGFCLFGDNDLCFASRVEKEPSFNFGPVDLIVKRDGRDAPLQFLHWVFAVPIPDRRALFGDHAE